jgi:Fe-S oxidoreductase
VLAAAGVHVELADRTDTGRPAHSKGLLDRSRARAAAAVEEWAPRVRDGWDVVCVEPSDAVMLQDDYLDLLGDPGAAAGTGVDPGDAEALAANAHGFCEYLDAFDLDRGVDWAGDGHLTYHGHCHQKATGKDHHAVGVLRRAGYAVDPLDSGCCGMAGSFGYEREHADMSRAIGDILLDQLRESGGQPVAPGASCRTQVGDREEFDRPPHPAEVLAGALAE